MTAPLCQQRPAIDPIAVFKARAEARATLYTTGEISLHEAVDSCQQLAEALGLVIELGQDAVQSLMVEAFAPLGDDLSAANAAPNDDDPWSAPGWRDAAISVVSYTPRR